MPAFSREDNEHYYLIRYASFCEQVEVDGVLRDKYVRQTRREIDEGTVREVYEDGFPEPKSKPFTYVDDEYAERTMPLASRSHTWNVTSRPCLPANRFAEGLSIRKQRMPCSRSRRGRAAAGRALIGRSPSFCSSGMRQMVSVG